MGIIQQKIAALGVNLKDTETVVDLIHAELFWILRKYTPCELIITHSRVESPFDTNDARVLRLCVCLPLAQCFNLQQMLMGQIAQNRCYKLAAVN